MMHETDLSRQRTRPPIPLRRRPGDLAWLSICCMILIGLAVVGMPDAAHAQDAASAGVTNATSDPNFNTIDDPLNGAYELFTVDDLLISRTRPENNNTKSSVRNYILETANETISSQSVVEVDTPDCYITGGRQPQQTRIGRFFNLDHDVIITLHPTGAAAGSECAAPDGEINMGLSIQNAQPGATVTTPIHMSAANTVVAMADFDLDGFEDLAIMNNTEAMVATARNTQAFTEGMIVGTVTAFGSTPVPERNPATGDFNNDGITDIAWQGAGKIHFATVCPGSIADTVCAEKEALEVILNPRAPIEPPVIVGTTGTTGPAALAAGRFGAYNGSGLVVFSVEQLLKNEVSTWPYVAHWYQFDDDWSVIGGAPIQSKQIDNPFGPPGSGNFAASARLNWLGNFDQVVFAHDYYLFGAGGDNASMTYILHVLTFNSTGTEMVNHQYEPGSDDWHDTGFIAPPRPPWLNGLAVGRFAAVDDDATGEGNGFTPQIALLTNDGKVRIFSVDPQSETPNYTPTLKGSVAVNPSLGLNLLPTAGLFDPQEPLGLNWLQAGDLQGRSARLGAPSVLRISSHSQPSVILGAPPMHVGYIMPDASTNDDWTVVNFSAVPDTFNSNYTMSQNSGNQSSDTNRTSYTYATTEQGGGDFSLKPPHVPSISGSIKTTSENKHEDVSETYAFTQDEFEYDASTTTGFGDEIWYDVSSFNVYYYPVLGETVCPADNANCPPDEEQQLYVTFSGPSSAGTGPGPGANTEWYQPVHQPGNIFSYPWNETQLKLQLATGVDLLTGPQSFYTDDSDQTQRLQWSSGAGQDQTTGSTNTHSYEKSYSLTGGKPIGKIIDVNLKGNLDYNSSTSISTLNKSSSSVGASQGIAIAKPGTFLSNNLYQYRVEPFIFGRTPLASTVDNVSLPQDIQTSGPLQAAFVANPLDPNAGSWWGSDVNPYTQQIDVALNHPVRWSKNDPSGTQEALNCLEAAGSRYNCITINDPNPSNLWNSEFYWMRGLFVTVGGVNGPQRTQATVGDEVVLQARVYNYSFKDMPSASTIQVRFYRQEIQGTTPVGDSVLIDQVTADPLPGFNSETTPDTPNWTTVTASLDTAGLSDTYHIFWVLVWAEDGSGNLIDELTGHGLSAKPGDLTSIGDVPLEEVMVSGGQKTFSNNVGYLHSKFYVAPQSAEPQSPNGGNLSIQNAAVTPQSVAMGERVIISADLRAAGAPIEATHVRIYPDAEAWRVYQNDPSLPQPRAFDVEMLSYIRADETGRLEVPYSAATCGTQEILIVAQAAGQAESVTASATFNNESCEFFFPVIASGAAE